MEKENTLDYLLQVESKAAAMVNEANEEAERRVQACEKENHNAHEERCSAQVKLLKSLLIENLERSKDDYQKALEEYSNSLSLADINVEQFSSLLNEYLERECLK